MQPIQQMIKVILDDKQPVVLAMIVNVDGSAYRKEGAWMFIQEDGTQTGVISGGCLESDLECRAEALFNTGKVETIQYDLSAEDDLGWGRGVGCNGVVTVLIRDVNHNFRDFLTLIHDRLLTKEPILFVQSISNFENYRILPEKEARFDVQKSNIFPELNTLIPFQNIAGQRKSNTRDEMVYRQLIWPQPSLYIIGAGIDARPIARMANHVGYAVHLLDRNTELCKADHFPTATSIQSGDVPKLISSMGFGPLDSVVIVTHDFQLDVRLVQALRDCNLLYFGILGSKKRTKRLFNGDIPNDIHSPVGLSIGADGPEEIAVSIIAELIAVRQGKKL